MSVLTKVFIVLLVVVSLMTSAGLIVFVNQTENFKVALKTEEDSAKTARAQAESWKLAASNAQADANSKAKDAAEQAAKLPELAAKYEGDLAHANSTIADLRGQLTVANVATVNATAALTASEAQRTAQATQLAATRTDNDALNKRYSDLSLAIADLTSRLEVAMAKAKEFAEADAEDKAENRTLQGVLAANFGGQPNPQTPVVAAPRINAVVDSTSTPGGIAHATISVGTDDEVKVGMQFFLIDSSKVGESAFLGMMTIDSVDARTASGRLAGPNIGLVHKGVEAKTHF